MITAGARKTAICQRIGLRGGGAAVKSVMIAPVSLQKGRVAAKRGPALCASQLLGLAGRVPAGKAVLELLGCGLGRLGAVDHIGRSGPGVVLEVGRATAQDLVGR